MPTLKSYDSAEKALIDTAYLNSMGLEGVVVHDPELLPGAVGTRHRIEIDASQIEQARLLLSQRASASVSIPTVVKPTLKADLLVHFLRFILIYDTVFVLVMEFFGHHFLPELPVEFQGILTSLALSETLWQFAYNSSWLLTWLIILANTLCFFFSPLGRSLFAVCIVWGILINIGPPPTIYFPILGFFFVSQTTLSGIALALMYWSPLRERFMPQSTE